MKIKLVVLLIFFFIPFSIFAQHRSLDLRPAYTWQKTHTIGIDIGIAERDTSWWLGYEKYFLGSELILNETEDPIYGFKAGYSICGLLPFLNFEAIYYTNFSKNQFVFRPEIGISWPGTWSISYGYNFYIPPNSLDISYHAFTFRYAFIVKHLKRK